MKLNLVPARQGWSWVRSGIGTFFKQPLALGGLFFMFMAAMSLLAILPFVGSLLALMLLPAATLGLMVATQQAQRGQFPMPSVLISAFRTARAQSMLALGVLYALGFLLVMGFSTLFDGGAFARTYFFGGRITPELLQTPSFQNAFFAAMVLYLPLSMMFWHAPGLVHWHGVSPVKSLFFSLVACLKNWRAFLVYGFAWFGLVSVCGMVVSALFGSLGGANLASTALLPTMMLLGAMLFTSLYFTYSDCFETDNLNPNSTEGQP
jgi:hypothetical protein